MLNKPQDISHTALTLNTLSDITTRFASQHGPSLTSSQQAPCCYFPNLLPREGVSRVTCYLDPPTLLCLGRVSKGLRDHVRDEDTWRRAFGVWYFGLSPESEFVESSLFKRMCGSWRKEFVKRWDCIRRWELSRTSTVLHTPLYARISSMHLISTTSSPTLLTSSLSLGIVARSLPLTGKVIRGFLDASGTGNGEVCILTAPRAMDQGPLKAAATVVRSKVDQDHTGTVNTVTFGDAKGSFVLSGANDGFVKLWDVKDKKVRCLWTSIWRPDTSAPDAVWKIVAKHGIVVAVMKSGWIAVWTEFPLIDGIEGQEPGVDVFQSVKVLWIPSPVQVEDKDEPKVIALHVVPSIKQPSFLVAYEDHPFFFVVHLSSAYTSVLTGDSLGLVSAYIIPSEASPTPVLPEAEVTSVAWNGTVLITGSSNGSLHVFDWTLVYHVPNSLLMVASVGERVIAFKTAPVPLRGPNGGVRGRTGGPLKKKDRHTRTKYLEKLELNEAIASERKILDQEQKYTQMVLGKEREQRESMSMMGLEDENDALAYALMLSMEDAGQAAPEPTPIGAVSPLTSGPLSEVDWAGEFDDIPSSSSAAAPSEEARSLPSSAVDDEGDFPTISPVASSPLSASTSSSMSAWGKKIPWDRTSVATVSSSSDGKKKKNKEVRSKTREEIEEEEFQLAVELSLRDAEGR
ncbi:hypothetical protein DL96DRAFT_1572926 [Flagelloscypha sp. PMI_526]|nr:hypothetical protein DL96DRAFT_1572926 [Flagelloscypha sp. PMI_526]